MPVQRIGVKQQEVFASIIQNIINNQGRNSSVISTGAVGYGTNQEFNFLRESGIKMKPTQVIINLFATNPVDII